MATTLTYTVNMQHAPVALDSGANSLAFNFNSGTTQFGAANDRVLLGKVPNGAVITNGDFFFGSPPQDTLAFELLLLTDGGNGTYSTYLTLTNALTAAADAGGRFVPRPVKVDLGDDQAKQFVVLALNCTSGSSATASVSFGGALEYRMDAPQFGDDFPPPSPVDFDETDDATLDSLTVNSVAGLNEGATTAPVKINATSSETITGETFPHLVLINQDVTNNNHIKVGFTDAATGGSLAATIDVIITDHDNNYGQCTVWTRGADGFLQRFVADESGNFELTTASGRYQHDGVDMSSLLWVSATAPASTLDGAGSVTLQASSGAQQFKIREMRLVGGGTNFGAGGDRTITVSDGTTTWTTIPNATLESLPADTVRWGDTELPFNGGTVDTASAAGTDITIQYAGGATDHSGTGSLTILACLEKVA